MPTNAMPTNAMPTNAMPANAMPANATQTNATQTNTTEPDHAVDLNNWLQRTPEGNVSPELHWEMTQEGPNNNAIHHAKANFRGDTLGMGHGISKGMAKRMAAKQALIRLRQNGLPQPQA